MEEESWRRNHRGGIMEEESWMRNHGGIMEEASCRSHHGGVIMEESSWRSHHRGVIMEESSWRRLSWELSGHSLGLSGSWGGLGVARGNYFAPKCIIYVVNKSCACCFEGACLTQVILAPGACGRDGLSSSS